MRTASSNPVLQALLRTRGGIRGLGLLEDYYYEDAYGNWYYDDGAGNYYGGDSGGGWYSNDAYGNYGDDGWGNYWFQDWSNLDSGNPIVSTDTAEPYNLPNLDASVLTSPNDSNFGGTSDWWASVLDSLGITPTTTGDPNLPGYCAKGYYHPANDPFSCIPFPADPAAKKAAQQQQKQQQQANAQAKAQQKKQDAACPKGQFKNPQTGKCQPIPQCPPGTAFDSHLQKCLTPQQAKDLYGSDYSWLWWVLGGIVVVRLASDYSNSRGRR